MRRHIRPEEALLAAYAALLVGLMAWTHTWQLSAFGHPRFLQCTAGLALAVLGRAWLRAHREGAPHPLRAALRPALGVVRDFLPFFVVLLLYEALHDLTPVIRPDVVDARLIAIDRAVLGVDISYWMGQFATPLLTRVMVLCYASYFIALPLLAAGIYWTGDRPLFRAVMLSGVLTTVIGYAGYLAVPAVGPYVFQADLYPTRLPGGGAETHLFIAAIDDLRGVARDCFPSLHTAHTTVVLIFARRFRRWAFLAYLPVAIGLYVSTMYLRMHYAVDVAAGFVTAFAAVALGPRLDRWWSGAPRSAAAVTVTTPVPSTVPAPASVINGERQAPSAR